MKLTELAFEATPAKGDVSALLLEADRPLGTLVFGHGAGADMRHAHLLAIAESLARAQVSTFRFNFPFMQAGGRRTDPLHVCLDTIDHAIQSAGATVSSPIFVGGHSFGARMASHLAIPAHARVQGLVYYSFPLHPAGRPGTARAQHLITIGLPQLFISGTRDALAEPALLRQVLRRLPGARLHELDTADHGFRTLKRRRQSTENVYDEAARETARFIAEFAGPA